MKHLGTLLAPLALVTAALTAPPQDVGSTVGPFELSDLAQTEATTWDDLLGRAVLLEFFAYW